MIAAPPETCERCRFDAAQYDRRDLAGTLRALGTIWRWTIEGVEPAVLPQRPMPTRRSVIELGQALQGDLGGALLGLEPNPWDPAPLDELPDAPPPAGPVEVAELTGELVTLSAAVDRALPSADADWLVPTTLSGEVVDRERAMLHLAHRGIHHLREVGRTLHALGAGTPTQSGSVDRVSASDGGVPKLAVDEAEVGERGLVGDRQAERRHHGRPWQALCLWSSEVIEELQAEGHPIEPGAAGENLTLAGLDWATIRPGTRMLIGEVVAEVSAWAAPCTKNAQWFRDGRFNRIEHDRHPGWSRAYAWVLEPGRIATGDPVDVEP